MSIVNQTIAFVKQQLDQAEAGHDFFHIQRVYRTAMTIAREEGGDMEVIQMAALLHDIADAKFHGGDESIGPQVARDWMQSQQFDPKRLEHVVRIVENISFKGGQAFSDFQSLELDIVRDADRLDAIGAIGIARTFHYGGFKNRQIYNPDIAPRLNMDRETYKHHEAPTINHFYEKLLLLKDGMRTRKGREMAEERHWFMESYLAQFYAEWEGL